MTKVAKAKNVFVCQACGDQSPRWLGRCPGCADWNTLVEERVTSTRARVALKSGRGGKVVALGDVSHDSVARETTGLEEFDRVLGGGLVPGGVVLLAGDPGIGKSTLVLQALGNLAARGLPCLYATGEESASQVALRGRRLNHLGDSGIERVGIVASTELEDVLAAIDQIKPRVMVLDSIQTVRTETLTSAPGSVAQLREVTTQLIGHTKRNDMALILIGHVTKDGAIAGPKVLEHLVDTVVSFEGDRGHSYRLVRSTKNRFGPAQEVGVFEMTERGLDEVSDPSALFLAERPEGASGSVVVATAEGSRPVLVELQALVAPAVYGSARRVGSGVDANRLAVLLAVLERKCGVHVLDRDVFMSAAGGLRVDERATDLGLAIAVVSSHTDKPVLADTCSVWRSRFSRRGQGGRARDSTDRRSEEARFQTSDSSRTQRRSAAQERRRRHRTDQGSDVGRSY